MSDTKYTSLLETLIAHAKTVGERENALLTAEKFLVAVLDAVAGTVSLPAGDTSAALRDFLDAKGIDPAASRSRLMEYINGSGSVFLDDLYMKKKLAAAEAKAKEEGNGISPLHLLDAILADPSAAVGACLGGNAAKPEDGTPDLSFLKKENKEDQKEEKEEEKEDDLSDCEDDTDEEFEAALRRADEPADGRGQIAALTVQVKDLRRRLSETVLGQENAVSVFAAGYFQAELLSLTDASRTRPRATFLFAGPPGVGKTFFAESAAGILGLPFARFDMSEYADPNAAIEFCGSDGVYKGSKSGNFTEFVRKNPRSLVLFDEIEKAHISIIHLFLQILDAGRIRDSHTDTELPLRDVIMIFTTNAGRQLYSDTDRTDFSTVSRKVILKALQRDVNPNTGVPYFPAAICSRFASGNVVMFNHIAAHSLTCIAKKEILRHAGNFEKQTGIRVEIDERVYPALLFAEGGAADARTVRSRAETFFDAELFELFRLLGTADSVDTIRMTVELPAPETEIGALFTMAQPPEILLFAPEKTAALCRKKNARCVWRVTDSPAEAEKLLREREIRMILIDMHCGVKTQKDYLNAEDTDSAARDFFRRAREIFADVPVYLLGTEDSALNQEERVSFLRQGARGILTVREGEDTFAAETDTLAEQLYQQTGMDSLARSNKVVRFETAQRMTDGSTAEIRLFDFALTVAMDPEDAEGVLNHVTRPDVTFDQVIGAEDAKRELKYFAEYLKNPKKYLGTGVAAPKGVLLYGPPGTGKTMLARAMAGESDVTFIAAEGNQFLKKYVGEGPEKVHELFRTARKYAPSILFIDEIDAIAKERTGSERNISEETLTAFLTEMDGFRSDTAKPVFVLAATNFSVEPGSPKSLDPALMRRFDRRVYIDLPNRDDRARYMRMKMAKHPAFAVTEEQLSNLAVRSVGMSLAQLESVLEMALRTALREGQASVTDGILEEAFETFNGGEKKSWELSQLERIARHEAGHTFLCRDGGETPSYVTVVARGDHGGYMQHGDGEGRALYTKEELLARIRTSLGGRAAEIVYYGEEDGISTGASGDLASATDTAQRLLCSYGMDDSFGLSVIDPESARRGEIAPAVRAAVNQILKEQMAEAVRRIAANRSRIDRLVEALLEKNHLTGGEITAILDADSKNP